MLQPNVRDNAESYAIKPSRKMYQAPRLTVHGSFRELTLKLGGAGALDNTSNPNSKSRS